MCKSQQTLYPKSISFLFKKVRTYKVYIGIGKGFSVARYVARLQKLWIVYLQRQMDFFINKLTNTCYLCTCYCMISQVLYDPSEELYLIKIVNYHTNFLQSNPQLLQYFRYYLFELSLIRRYSESISCCFSNILFYVEYIVGHFSEHHKCTLYGSFGFFW